MWLLIGLMLNHWRKPAYITERNKAVGGCTHRCWRWGSLNIFCGMVERRFLFSFKTWSVLVKLSKMPGSSETIRLLLIWLGKKERITYLEMFKFCTQIIIICCLQLLILIFILKFFTPSLDKHHFERLLKFRESPALIPKKYILQFTLILKWQW